MARAKPPAKKPAGKAAPAKTASKPAGNKPVKKPVTKKPVDAPAKRKPGGQTTFDMAVVDRICDALAEGRMLDDILREDGMPSRKTFYTWRETNPEAKAAFLAAKEVQVERYVDETIAIADEPASFPADVARNKARVTARQWYAEKLVPKLYGQKVAIGGAADLPPIQSVHELSTEALLAIASGKEG